MISLYIDGFWISPYAFSAFVALEELGVAYDVKPLFLNKKEHRTPEYERESLTGRIPALRDGDFWVSESQAIVEYLADAFPPPRYPRLFPENVRERARCRQLMAWVRSDLMPIREERPTTSMFYEPAKEPLTQTGQAAAARLLRVAEALVQEGRSTLFGNWCIADADFSFMLQRLHLNGHPMPAKVTAYCEANWKRPAAQKWANRSRAPYEPY